jgi:hypothetical protein
MVDGQEIGRKPGQEQIKSIVVAEESQSEATNSSLAD